MQLEKYRLMIKEHHVDSLGHMNNATFMEIFEDARWDVISHRGYGFDKVQELQQGPIIMEVNLKFLKEIKLRETVEVTTELLEYPGKVGKLRQRMLKTDGSIAAEAVFTFGLFDMKTRRLIDATPEWKRGLGLDS